LTGAFHTKKFFPDILRCLLDSQKENCHGKRQLEKRGLLKANIPHEQ